MVLGRKPLLDTAAQLSEGPRCYLCVGPNCWGKAFSAKQAEQNARSNWSKSLSGPWKCIMYDAPADCVITPMGDSEYTPSFYAPEHQRGAVELYRVDSKPVRKGR